MPLKPGKFKMLSVYYYAEIKQFGLVY